MSNYYHYSTGDHNPVAYAATNSIANTTTGHVSVDVRQRLWRAWLATMVRLLWL